MTIRKQVEDMIACINKKNTLSSQFTDPNVNCEEKWEPPLPGFFKLNCDASARENGRFTRCGGVLRDSKGNFCFGFVHRLDPCAVPEAELLGVYHGVWIVWRKGYKKLEVETDSCLAFDLVSENSMIQALECIIGSIKEVGGQEFNVSWKFIIREMNVVADKFAKACHGNSVWWKLYYFWFHSWLFNQLYSC